MVSCTVASNLSLVSPYSLADLTSCVIPSCSCFLSSRKGGRRRDHFDSLYLAAGNHCGSLLAGFFNLKRVNSLDSSWGFGGFVRRCKKGWEGEGDLALEAEILEFMKNSDSPQVFPSKKQLIDGGRMDLVEAIMRQGGWLSLGWDSDEDDEEDGVQVRSDGYSIGYWDSVLSEEFKNGVPEQRFESEEVGNSGYNSTALGSHSSSGRSLETAPADNGGIDGILSRLEKERDISFGFSLSGKRSGNRVQNHEEKDDLFPLTLTEMTVAGFKRSGLSASTSPSISIVKDSAGDVSRSISLLGINGLTNSLKTEMWRNWSMQRAGCSNMEFEAADIASADPEGTMDSSENQTLELIDGANEPLKIREDLSTSDEEINNKQIHSRLQHLELELSSVLCSLRSKSDEESPMGDQVSCDNFQKLSDAWEFQENEIMNAQDKLRSMRAKLAVLEGKMALAIIEGQKILEEKQKRIDSARKALRLLRTTCIVWTNSASEVLLAGSFDGWMTQRKMEKSSAGIFSVYLKLYPGRYEIKFIVDGEWRIDPLRPLVRNNGYENNLLIVS